MKPSKEEIKYAKKIIKDMDKSPCSFYVIDNNKKYLLDNGFEELVENKDWDIKPGGKYFFTKNLSAIIAFTVPKDKIYSFMICASHSDHPALKVKHKSCINVNNTINVLNADAYASPMFYSFLDKPLSVAGRLLLKTKEGLCTKLVNIDRPLVLIPYICAHLNRQVNQEGLKVIINPQMRPLFSGNDTDSLIKFIANEYNINRADVFDFDLFVYNYTKATIWGANREFVSSKAIDDQASVYSSLYAICEAKSSNSISMHVVFDHEEIGSGTKQGAQSSILTTTLKKICKSLNMSSEQYVSLLPSSLILSADNGHGYHPNFEEKSNPTTKGNMGDGIMLKYDSSFSYSTDGLTGSLVKIIANNANVKVQEFACRTGQPTGGTLAKFISPSSNIMAADIGLSQLAMHSSYETCATKDLLPYKNLIKKHFESSIIMEKDGTYIVK